MQLETHKPQADNKRVSIWLNKSFIDDVVFDLSLVTCFQLIGGVFRQRSVSNLKIEMPSGQPVGGFNAESIRDCKKNPIKSGRVTNEI